MSVDRIKFQNIVESQVPDYVRDDFPLLVEFLKQYYVSQENESGTYDLIQNIDQYVKVDELSNLVTSTVLSDNVSYTDTTIRTASTGNFTDGFPNRDGLIQIDSEIIYYEYKTDTTFENCSRGFSAVTSYESTNAPDELVFTESEADTHTSGAEIKNLNNIFLQEFFKKIKNQFVPGFSERTLYSDLDQRNFVFGADSFYKSKGTDRSFEILFRALYGKDVEVIRPSEFLLRPSSGNYKVTNDIVVEQYLGDPLDLKNRTLFQDSTGSRGSISNVRPVSYNEKTYYQVSVDYGYQRDIDTRGSIFSEFKPNSKTRVLNSVSVGSSVIEVDSTIGFSETGSLDTKDIDNNPVTITYSGKNDNQFFNVIGVIKEIPRSEEISSSEVAYAYVNRDSQQKIEVKISSALKNITFNDKNNSLRTGDTIKVQSLGTEINTEKTRNWIPNLKIHWKVKSLTLIDSVERVYNVVVEKDTFLKSGFEVTLRDSDNNLNINANVKSVFSKTEFSIKTESLVDLRREYVIENQTLHTNSSTYSYLDKYITNVQNTYSKFNGDLLVSSNSIPTYKGIETNPYNRSFLFTGSATNNIIQLVNSGDHGFFTGDAIYYNPGVTTTTTTDTDGNQIVIETLSSFTGVNEGVYYVKRVNEISIKLSKSRSDIFEDKYISLGGSVTDVTFTYFKYYNKPFGPQSIYRSVLTPVNETGFKKTIPGYTGILINGVEILNYKSPNKINYGTITGFNVVNGGKGYDIINPPVLTISDVVGTGATGVVNVKGQLERIDILDTGFDYQKKPVVSISGGNGSNASAEVRLSSVTHSVSFNVESSSAQISLGSSTIGFSTYHKFRDNEEVIYKTDTQQGISGLTTGASYYVGVVDSKTIKLYETPDDSLVGINTVALNDFGIGVHRLQSSTLKNVVTSVVVTNPGSGYENKERKIVGINTALDRLTITNHGYSSKEIVRYSSSSPSVDGLVDSKDYYVVKIDDNTLSLTEIGVGDTSVDYYYNNNISVNLRSTGSGSFNYKPIVVSVDGITGVSTRTDQNFSCQVQPVFRGSIESVDLTESGTGYGSSEIVNFDRQPLITLNSGSNAVLIPIINNGQIVDVIINNSGSGYNSPPDLEITTTTGKNASLTPVLNNGAIESVKIIKPGAGYVANKTSIKVLASGGESVINSSIKEWNINLFERNFDNINGDDGILDLNLQDNELQYSHLYAPRPLRENTFVIAGTSDDNTLYGTFDLTKVNGQEISNTYHSPIIGWAYDGNPIYGPYGFSNPAGSASVKRMQSGYGLKNSIPNRPSFSLYPSGFFVEDYEFVGDGDLDEHNGRFCVTPDYPNGVYAYFTTINSTNDSSGPFDGYRRPQFPYVIGDTFHSIPNSFNFKSSSNQNEYDIQNDGWLRNTYYYNLDDTDNGYDYIFNSNLVKEQNIIVTSASSGTIQNIGIVTGGSNYQLNDTVVFDNSGTNGKNARAYVSSLKGKQIQTVSVSSTIFYGVEFTPSVNGSFLGLSTEIHSFDNGDIVNVTGLSSYFKGLDGSYIVGVRSDNFVLNLGLSTANTNDVDYAYVGGNLNFPSIRPNDILTVDSEKVRVLNIDSISKRIRIQRGVEGTTPVPHSNSKPLYENPKKFTINVGSLTTTRTFNINTVLYFDPAESVGLGTVLGTGIGNTITFSNPGVGITQVFVEPQSIYYPDHELRLNDKVIYSSNGGTSIQVWNGISTSYVDLTSYPSLYAVPLSNSTIGISSNKVGLSSLGTYVGVNTTTALLYFTSVGVGNTHNFTTVLNDVITTEVSKNTVTVSTASSHGLKYGDYINVNIKPTFTETVTVKYDDFNRRIVFDPRSFVSGDVDTLRNTIQFSNEYFKLGDKVIHTSSSPSGGLKNEGIYYVVPFNGTKVRLVRERYEVTLSNPNFVDITSASSGTLSKINPLVNIKKNNKLKFDLSDKSLSYINSGVRYAAFDMNLYSDREYSNIFFTTGNTSSFEVTKTGRPGVDSNANLTLNVRDDIPSQLYYKFDTDNNDLIPNVKSQIIIDEDVTQFNGIEIIKTNYDGSHSIVGISTTSFKYSIPAVPDVSVYDSSNSNPEYTTNSSTAYGPISKINILNGGVGYRQLPGITSIRSGIGSNAILTISGDNVGQVLNSKFEDIGYNYPSDQTLKVVANVPEVLEVDTLYSFESIGITSSGKNYLVNPSLIVLDGFTRKVVENVDIRYTLGSTEVDILKNTNGLYEAIPTIIPVQNSNGVGISSITYTDATKVVRVYLDAQFSDSQDFRYKTGAKVLIENVAIGIGSTDRGYNSQNYGYNLFEVTSFDAQVGGSGAYFEYNLSGYLKSGEIPGTFDSTRSSGRAIPESDFPVFNITLTTNNFFVDEEVTSGDKKGVVERWNSNNKTLIVSSPDEFDVGSKIIGKSSGTEVIVGKKFDFNSSVSTGAGTTYINGWQSNIGFLNDSLQRIPNNEYYQNLSYSLKSVVPLETWDDTVSSLGHVSGLAKFADLTVESVDDITGLGVVVPVQSDIDVVIDVISEANIHCFTDFDSVSENAVDNNRNLISDEIYFTNRTLVDYNESFGNRALSIDDFSSTFNSIERSTLYSTVSSYSSNQKYNKILTHVHDTVLTNRRQVLFVSVLHNNTTAYISEYADVDTRIHLGSFDFVPNSDSSEWFLRFYPTDFAYNSYDVSTLSFSLLDNVSGVGTTTFGNIIEIDSSHVDVPVSTTTTVVSIANTYRSSKLLVQIEDTNNDYSISELNLIHDGTDVYLLEYGDIATNTTGFGTFNAYISGSNVVVDLVPSVGVALTVNSSIIATADSTVTGVAGTVFLDYAKLESAHTSIASSGSPGVTTISSLSDPIESSYYVVTVEDTTNNEYESFEVISLKSINGPSEFVEYANIYSNGSLGQVGLNTSNGTIDLTYTPNASIDVEVRVFSIGMLPSDIETSRPSLIDLNNLHIKTDEGTYIGNKLDLMTAFGLKHKGDQIFLRGFDGSDPSIVSTTDNSVLIPNHFFVTGEEVTYTSPGIGSTASIGIALTTVPGIGLTDKLPSTLYVVALDSKQIQFATTAENALKTNPVILSIGSTGIGVGHSITATKQNQKVLLAVDNIVQSPIVAYGVTSALAQDVVFQTDILLTGITSIFTGDNLRIGDEIVTVASVGVGNTTSINVIRARMGTTRASHTAGDLVEKLSGEYNIVGNTLNFASAPKGPTPVGVAVTVDPDEVDWTGLTTSSSFQGRSFMRSGIPNTTEETYTQNYIFDNISYKFTGITSEFTLTNNGSNVTGIATQNAFVVINGITQQPTGDQLPSLQVGDFRLSEETGITSITFTGNGGLPTGWDPNNGAYPIGGSIVSIGSSNGFGYQPLVAAGGTVTVSSTGTITSVSIANSGSGYRSGIQTVVNVGVQTYSSGIPNIEFIGTAAISGGHIVSVAITNPGVGYTGTNLPDLVIDDPLSYDNIPLEYSPGVVGSGQSATIDIVVGQGSSVINFRIRNPGFGYGNNEKLTIPTGGTTGIPTDPSVTFERFDILIDKTYSDNFNSWSVGELEVLDTFDSKFDGATTNFQLTLNEEPFVIQARTGSPIDLDQTLIVFINDVLQVPGNGYEFTGGSIIKFSEAPKVGDTSKVIFYKGTSGTDVRFVEILETVKVGDTLDIDNNPELGQGFGLDEDPRVVNNIITADTVETIPYIGPGITRDQNLLRPVTWCKQLVDKIIDGEVVGKDRTHYEPLIYPASYLIQPVSAAATFGYVDSVTPLYDGENEATKRQFQNRIIITSQDLIDASTATATVSVAGTISSINITNAGLGYTLSPEVTISTPIGIGTTQRATATGHVVNGGLNSVTVVNPGTGYTSSNPPKVLISTPKQIRESIPVSSYVGDYGVVVAMGRSTISGQDELIVDFYIPEDSYMRDVNLVGSAVTVSGISTGDYFTMFNTNVSVATTAGTLISQRIDGSHIGITTVFADLVYQAKNAYTVESNVSGVGVTYVRRIFSNLVGITSGTSFDKNFITFDSTLFTFDSREFQIFTGGITTSHYLGEFSWGKVDFESRVGINTFNFYGNDGYTGISTSALVIRQNPLKSDNYV